MAYIDQKTLSAAVPAPIVREPRMLISTEGAEGSGKTHFALNGTPRPLTFLDFDFGFEGLGGGDPALSEGVTRYAFDVLGVSLGATDEQVKAHAKAEMHRFIAEFQRAIRDKVRTLVVDTFTAAWSAQRIAHEGDSYEEMREEFKALIRLAYASPHTNLILIHHLKQDWAKNREGKSYPSGTYSRDGMDGVLAAMQLAIRQRYIQPKIANGAVQEPGRFELDVLKCRDNLSMTGSTYTGLDWQTLCSMAAPRIDWSK